MLQGEEFEWVSGTVVEIPPETVHRMEALEDSVILEVSTPELDDVVRLEDRYGRAAD
jgi:quercetin dioxygenase-like cupin family protein